MGISIIRGDLLASNEAYIGHQCNCVTIGQGAGLARSLFKLFPYADTYRERKSPAAPGTYSVHGNGKDQRFIVNLYAQYHPGKPKNKTETKALRLEWLISGLTTFVESRSPTHLALPHGIGCGLAGGVWEEYFRALDRFATAKKLTVILYKL